MRAASPQAELPAAMFGRDGRSTIGVPQGMAVRLSAVGVDVDLRAYPASPPGFTGHVTSMARAARDDIKTWLKYEPR